IGDQPLVAVERSAIDDVTAADLATGPVLRAWITPDGRDSDLALARPLACADTSTWTLLIEEVAAAYEGRPATSEDPVQYADYAEWQQQTIAGSDETAAAGRDYW